MCYLKNRDYNILQPVPSHKFMIDVQTKYCKTFKQFVGRHFLKSYVIPMLDKTKNLKNEQILQICVIKNHDKIILQPIPSQKLIIDMYGTCCYNL